MNASAPFLAGHVADDVDAVARRARLSALLEAHAPFVPAPLLPSVVVPMAQDELPVWQGAEEIFGGPLPAPFWAVAWPGAQALARAVAVGLVPVAGRVVVDVGCGSGLAAVVAARHGAARVLAIDVDPVAVDVALLTAAANDVVVGGITGDPIAGDDGLLADADVVLLGDVVYNVDTAARLVQRVRAWRAAGKDVVLADSGRPFFSADGAPTLAAFDVDVPRAVEGVARRRVTVYRHDPPSTPG
jgi:predicted nicotinamide N-methyase